LENKFSVVMPVHKGLRFLNRAMKSLVDSRFNGELVIVENGSMEIDMDYVSNNTEVEFEVKVVHLKTSSVSMARNVGIRNSAHPVISFLDVDDEFTINRMNYIECVVPDKMFVIGTQEIGSKGSALGEVFDQRLARLKAPKFHPIAVLVSKFDLEKVGGFDETLSHGSDLDLVARLIASGLKPVYANSVFVVRHFHDFNLTNNLVKSRQGMFNVLRKQSKGYKSK